MTHPASSLRRRNPALVSRGRRVRRRLGRRLLGTGTICKCVRLPGGHGEQRLVRLLRVQFFDQHVDNAQDGHGAARGGAVVRRVRVCI